MKTKSAAVPAAVSAKAASPLKKKDSIAKRFWKTRFLFVLWLPALVYYIMFHYIPMYGISIAFFDYNAFTGWEGATWRGLYHFEVFFNSPDFWKLTRNTLVLGLQNLFYGFPITILFALLLNEIRNMKFKKVVQTVSYMPHFLSVVVVCGLFTSILDPISGAVNVVIKAFGGEAIKFTTEKEWYRPIYLISGLWQELGWGTIIYLAAISGVDPALYEAARLDGAGRWRQMWSITIPSIAPTVCTMLILRVGGIMGSSLEKALLLGNGPNSEYSEVLVTYVFNKGLGETNFSFSTAVSLWTQAINLILLLSANFISKKIADSSIF